MILYIEEIHISKKILDRGSLEEEYYDFYRIKIAPA